MMLKGKHSVLRKNPEIHKANYIVPGLYFYNNDVVGKASNIVPSARGELEITSINNSYLEEGKLNVIPLDDQYTWFDAGNADSLYEAAGVIKDAQRSGEMIGCPEEIAFLNQWIDLIQLICCAEELKSSRYGQ